MKNHHKILAILLLLCGCSPSAEVAPPTAPQHKNISIKITDDVSYILDDAEARHEEFPDTFWIPSAEERMALTKDELVKLMFQITVDGEYKLNGCGSLSVREPATAMLAFWITIHIARTQSFTVLRCSSNLGM